MDYRITSIEDPDVAAILEYHHKDMLAVSPPGTAYAFDIERLNAPDIAVFGAWDGDALLGVGALRSHSDYAEIKSMRVLPQAKGKGLGKGLLELLLSAARDAGFKTMKLETGISAPFNAANGLYTSFGFTETDPFAGYEDNGDNRFYELSL
ncbi:MAG: GNAT family N-acetyltransferase [Pseudomonadota bacterium]